MTNQQPMYTDDILDSIRLLFMSAEFTKWFDSLLVEPVEDEGRSNLPDFSAEIRFGRILSPGAVKVLYRLLCSDELEGLDSLDERVASRYRAIRRTRLENTNRTIKDDWPPIAFSIGGEPFAAHPDDPKYALYRSLTDQFGSQGTQHFELLCAQRRLVIALGQTPSNEVAFNHEGMIALIDQAIFALDKKRQNNIERGWMTANDPSEQHRKIALEAYLHLSKLKPSVGWKALQTECIARAQAAGIARDDYNRAFSQHGCRKFITNFRQ